MTIDQDTSSTDKLRVSRLDAILFLLSTAVILLSLWPTIGPRQSLSYTTGDGEVKHCVLPADDLRVQRLKKIWHDHQNLKPNQELSTARWQSDLADYYLARTAKPGSQTHGENYVSVELDTTQDAGSQFASRVQQKSKTAFVMPASHQRDNTESSPLVSGPEQTFDSSASLIDSASESGQAYWIEKKQSAVAKMDMAGAMVRTNQAEPPPLRLGPVLEGRKTASSFFISLLAAAVLTFGFVLWCQASSRARAEISEDTPKVRRAIARLSPQRFLLAYMVLWAMLTLVCS